MKKSIQITLLTLTLLLVVTGISYAQPPGFPSAPDAAPIDGGLSLLAAAGGAYALKKLKGKKSTEEEFH